MIMVIFSVSGEGKIFIIINLGMSFVLIGKKVILFGFDFCKFKLSSYLIGKIFV